MTAESPDRERLPSILIVDDTPANLELLSGLLRDRGYEPRPVSSGRLALAAAKVAPPDLILLDIRMPEMDGFEVCAQLKADAGLADIPVIFISALSDTTEKVRAFSMGGMDYVTKPFQAEEVEARVRTHLRVRSLQRQLRDRNQYMEQQVAERTRDLAQANERLADMGRLKDEFLGMISHELRTPTNGVLGIGELLCDLCPPSEDYTRYRQHFDSSRARLVNLIEDAAMLADLDQRGPASREVLSVAAILAQVRQALPEIQILSDQSAIGAVMLGGEPALMKRVLETLVRLAAALSKDAHRVGLSGVVEDKGLRVRLDVDALTLSAEQASDFFTLESRVRTVSSAEPLGLAPVVARKILAAFGGELTLVKGEAKTGYLEAVFPATSIDTRGATQDGGRVRATGTRHA
ncbi:MAG: hybrid sensor histidine kinase/response regulator [Acidobacteriota bacterium]